MLQLYTWGNGHDISPLDAESHAVIKLIEDYCPKDSVSIHPNSNYFQSNNGRLPLVLTEHGQQVQGYKNICRYLFEEFSLEIDSKYGFYEKLVREGLLEKLLLSLYAVTLYNFYLSRDNYVGLTRTAFQEYLPFPMQYKAPIDLKNEAHIMCEKFGLNVNDAFDDDDDEKLRELKEKERELKETPVINDLQKVQMNKELEAIKLRRSLITNMKCLSVLREVIEVFQDVCGLESQGKVEILFWSYLKCNVLKNLKNQFIRAYLKENFNELLVKVDGFEISGFGSLQIVNGELRFVQAISSCIREVI